MYHTIEFRLAGVADFEIPGRAGRGDPRGSEARSGEARGGQARSGETRTKQLIIKPGTRMRAQIRPYVVESREGPIEVADLLLENGTFSRAVRFASFHFVDGARS